MDDVFEVGQNVTAIGFQQGAVPGARGLTLGLAQPRAHEDAHGFGRGFVVSDVEINAQEGMGGRNGFQLAQLTRERHRVLPRLECGASPHGGTVERTSWRKRAGGGRADGTGIVWSWVLQRVERAGFTVLATGLGASCLGGRRPSPREHACWGWSISVPRLRLYTSLRKEGRAVRRGWALEAGRRRAEVGSRGRGAGWRGRSGTKVGFSGGVEVPASPRSMARHTPRPEARRRRSKCQPESLSAEP